MSETVKRQFYVPGHAGVIPISNSDSVTSYVGLFATAEECAALEQRCADLERERNEFNEICRAAERRAEIAEREQHNTIVAIARHCSIEQVKTITDDILAARQLVERSN